MIPTYRPTQHLVAALSSVLAQDPGPSRMQIAVIDDASSDTDVEGLVASAAPPGRVEVHRHGVNLNLAGNWNRCIEKASGGLVHILHQDDMVLPDFYRTMTAALERTPAAGMAFCRCGFVDSAGARIGATRRRAWRAGIKRDWLERIAEATRVQCPGVVIRRSTYERLGGYRTDLVYALDQEMWVRIAAAFDVWYEPRILALFRKHGGNATTRLEASGVTDADVLKAIGIFSQHLPAGRRASLTNRAYREFVRLRLRHTARALGLLPASDAARQIDLVRRLMSEVPASSTWRNRIRLRWLERRVRSAVAR